MASFMFADHRHPSGASYTWVRCPKCPGMIVYNGNYYCEHYDDKWCDWALPHPQKKPLDRWLSWILTGTHEGVETLGPDGWRYSGDRTRQPKSDLARHTDAGRLAHYRELIAERSARKPEEAQ